jgi:NAD(P)-dependent dehydrogenase (short-subunit alcohol dehydrogenase family)
MSQNVVSSSSQSQYQSQPRKGVALITGASRGIGCGIALRLADDGYDIAANGQTSTVELNEVVKKIEEKGRRALAVPGDVSEESVVEDMIKRTVSTLGSLDVVRTTAPSVLAGFGPSV